MSHRSTRTISLICGACDRPANLHPFYSESATDFTVECYRESESIGYSTWYSSDVVLKFIDGQTKPETHFVYTYSPDTGGYIEALGVFDLGTPTQRKVYSRRLDREVNDYFLVDGTYVTVAQDLSGTEAQSGSDLIANRIADDRNIFGIGADDLSDPNANVDLLELDKLDRWNDATFTQTASTKSWVSTSVLGETEGEYTLTQLTDSTTGKKSYTKVPLSSDEVISTEQRNAYVEGNDGFLSLHLLDEQLTRKYHARLLNVFLDKQTNDVRIGSIRITKLDTDHNGHDWIQAKCVNNACGPVWGKTATLTINTTTASREEQEDFILAVISHGNNHAAKWFTTRPEFYMVHKPGCDLSEPKTATTCLHRTSHAESLNEVEFLMEHQRYCSSSKCACSERLAELAPVLAKVS